MIAPRTQMEKEIRRMGRPPFGRSKVCPRCRTVSRETKKYVDVWVCGGCKVKCCQHLCTDKDGKKGTCWACKRAQDSMKACVPK